MANRNRCYSNIEIVNYLPSMLKVGFNFNEFFGLIPVFNFKTCDSFEFAFIVCHQSAVVG